MSALAVSDVLKAARLQGMQSWLDAGGGNARIQIMGGDWPGAGVEGGTELAVIELAKPCGKVEVPNPRLGAPVLFDQIPPIYPDNDIAHDKPLPSTSQSQCGSRLSYSVANAAKRSASAHVSIGIPSSLSNRIADVRSGRTVPFAHRYATPLATPNRFSKPNRDTPACLSLSRSTRAPVARMLFFRMGPMIWRTPGCCQGAKFVDLLATWHRDAWRYMQRHAPWPQYVSTIII